MRKLLYLCLILSILISTVFFISTGGSIVKADASWLSGYNYRQEVTIDGTADGEQIDYQMVLTVNKTTGTSSGSTVYLKNHALSWTSTVPNDIRFTEDDGSTELDYWIESSDANTAQIWVEFSNILELPSGGTFYIYYGKEGDTTTSDGASTFPFFDYFPGSSLNGQWDNTSGSPSVSGGYLVLPGDSRIRASGYSCLYGTRFRARIETANNTTTGKLRIGLSNTAVVSTFPTDDAAYSGFVGGVADYIGINAYDDGLQGSATGITALSGDTWYIWEQTLTSSAYKAYIDGTLEGTVTTYLPDENLNPRIEQTTAGQTAYVDWVFISNFTTNEPTWGGWGAEVFVTTIVTEPGTNVGGTIARINGEIVSTGGYDPVVTFYWGLTDEEDDAEGWDNSDSPTYPSQPQGLGEFYEDLTGLDPETEYFFNCAATNDLGTFWGTSDSFITSSISDPTLTTSVASNVYYSMAKLNGEVTDIGGDPSSVTFYWGTTDGETDSEAWDSSGEASYPDQPQLEGICWLYAYGLNSNTKYYYSASAENAHGTSWGSTKNFTTSYHETQLVLVGTHGTAISPDDVGPLIGATADTIEVQTSAASSINPTTATLNGIIIHDGDANCSIRFEYGTTTSYGSSTGWMGSYTTGQTFNYTITSLSPYTTYYFKAEARHSDGYTVKGFPLVFSTSTSVPTVTTKDAIYIGTFTAQLRGYLDDQKGSSSCQYRFEYGTTTSYGTTSDWYGTIYSGTNFILAISDLTADTTYHFKAECQNSYGIGYGDDESFTTGEYPSAPTGLTATPTSSTTISLSWLKGDSAPQTIIAYKLGDYPSAYDDGTVAYSGSATSYVLSGLSAGTTYYFAAWGYDVPPYYSTGYITAAATTFSGSGEGEGPGDTGGTNTITTDRITHLPGYDLLDWAAGSLGMDSANFFLMIGLMVCLLVGVYLMVVVGSMLYTFVAVMFVLSGMYYYGVVPWWALMFYAILGASFLYLTRRQSYSEG